MDRKDCFSRPPLDCSWLSRRGSGWRCSYRLAGLGFVHPIEARYLWGILSGVYLPEIGRPTPEVCARRLCQRKNLSFRTPAARAETYVPSQLVRCRRGRRKAWPAWRREPGRFASFDALIKGRGRVHPHKIVLFVISRPNRVQNQRKYVCRLVGGTSVRYLAANRFLYANGVFGCVPFQNETAGREKTCGFE